MSATILGRTLRGALMSGLLLGLSAMALQAAPAASQPAPASVKPAADRAADQSAVDDLHKAMAALAKGERRAARDFLERADTALLNREVLDLGPSLRTGQPLPETPLRQQIKQAEAAAHGANAAAEKDAVNRAVSALEADAAHPQS
jgi:hypothetical protein